MPDQKALSDDNYDLTLRLWSEHTPLKPIVSHLGFRIDDFVVMGQTTKRGNRIAHRHFACIASAQVQTAKEAEAWLAATLGQMARTGARFGPDIEALFWIAQFGRTRQESMVPSPILVARAVEHGARIFVENYTPQGADGVSDDEGADASVKTWYPPD